jgi:AcrR family transcriptional regulator
VKAVENDPFARRKIMLVAGELVKERGSQNVQFEDVAERANVDVDVLDTYFDSRTQMIAEVQMANYFVMVEPIHLGLSRIEGAVADGDEASFWSGIEENLAMSWSSGQMEKKWGIINLLHDVWSDPFTQTHFCDLLDIQFNRWISVIEGAQANGWIDESIDAAALTSVYWSASVGQVITAGSTSLHLSPENVRDFFMSFVRGKDSQGSSRL